MTDNIQDAMYAEIEYHKCRGCECFSMVFSEPEEGLVWECELEAIGEPCYMGDDSYNEKYLEVANCCFYEDCDCIHPIRHELLPKCLGVDCGWYYGKDELIYE